MVSQLRRPDEAMLFIDFENMRYVGTDIDYFMDYRGKANVFVDVKNFKNTSLSVGQRRAYEALGSSYQDAIVIIAGHSVDISDGVSVDLATCLVVSYYHNGEWHIPKRKDITVREAIDTYISYVEEEGRVL